MQGTMRTVRIGQNFDNMGYAHYGGEGITQADISSISYVVLLMDETTYNAGGSVSVASCVFDEPQTDGRWTEDSIGYNFRHTFPNNILAAIGQYVIKYTFTASDGGVFFGEFPVQTVRFTTPI